MVKLSASRGVVLLLVCALSGVAQVGCGHSQPEATAASKQGALGEEGSEAPQKAVKMKFMPTDFKKR